MPVTGWVSDRLGRRRTLVLAMSVLLVGTLGAAVSPTLPVLVAFRAVQGLGCALVPVAVMGTLARTWPDHRRSRVMGAWGAANGIGQAVGPPVGGLLADAFGWRAIFWVLLPVTLGVLVLAARMMPRDAGTPVPIDARAVGPLTLGVAALMTAVTIAPQDVPGWAPAAAVAVGVLSLALFVVAGLRRPDGFIDPRLLVEMRWLRSATGVFVQQVTLFSVLVAVPLHLTGVVDLSGTATGLLVFLLPVVWAASAPLVGRLSDRIGPRPVLRTGLVVLFGGVRAAGGAARQPVDRGPGVRCRAGRSAGLGVALVQTPSLTGATRSPAGQRGAGLGLFNMMRFVGASVGAAGVAAAYPGLLGWLFGGCAAVLALVGLGLSFAGREVADAPPAAAPPAG